MVGGAGDVTGHPGDGRGGPPSAAGEDGAVRRVSRNSKHIDSLKLKLRHLDGLQAKIDAGLEASAEQRTRLARRPALTAELAACTKGLERFGSVRARLDGVLDTKLLRRHYDRAGHMKCKSKAFHQITRREFTMHAESRRGVELANLETREKIGQAKAVELDK